MKPILNFYHFHQILNINYKMLIILNKMHTIMLLKTLLKQDFISGMHLFPVMFSILPYSKLLLPVESILKIGWILFINLSNPKYKKQAHFKSHKIKLLILFALMLNKPNTLNSMDYYNLLYLKMNHKLLPLVSSKTKLKAPENLKKQASLLNNSIIIIKMKSLMYSKNMEDSKLSSLTPASIPKLK
jgi:hypothetical protein